MTTENKSKEIVFAPQEVSAAATKSIHEISEDKGLGLRTGIASIDKKLNPMYPGRLRIIMGYTSNYKSGMMNYIARHNAEKFSAEGKGRVVVTVTWEQSVDEQGMQDISFLTGISITDILREELSDTQWNKIKGAAVDRGKIPWWLLGHVTGTRRPRMTMEDVYNALAYMVDVQGVKIGLVLLDYLQRINITDTRSRDTTRVKFMNTVDDAKDLALAFGCPVILGTQAGRQVKTRAWRLPQTDDGQETSNLEQSADDIFSLWLPHKDYPIGHMLEYGDKTYIVEERLLITGIMKQKFGGAPIITPLHIRPEINEIYDVEEKKVVL